MSMQSISDPHWSGDTQLFVQNGRWAASSNSRSPPGRRAEAADPALTKSCDYGILRFTVNGQAVPQDYDAYSLASRYWPTPLDLGIFTPSDKQFRSAWRSSARTRPPRAEVLFRARLYQGRQAVRRCVGGPIFRQLQRGSADCADFRRALR